MISIMSFEGSKPLQRRVPMLDCSHAAFVYKLPKYVPKTMIAEVMLPVLAWMTERVGLVL